MQVDLKAYCKTNNLLLTELRDILLKPARKGESSRGIHIRATTPTEAAHAAQRRGPLVGGQPGDTPGDPLEDEDVEEHEPDRITGACRVCV